MSERRGSKTKTENVFVRNRHIPPWNELTLLYKILSILFIFLATLVTVLVGLIIFLGIRKDIRITKCEKIRIVTVGKAQESTGKNYYPDLKDDSKTFQEHEFKLLKKSVVSIHYNWTTNNTDVAYCVGSILDKDYVITSSQCVREGQLNTKIYIRAGSIYPYKEGSIHLVDETSFPDWRLFTSQEYDFNTLRYISIIKVTPQFKIDNITLATIKLPPNRRQRFVPSFKLYSVGWGTHLGFNNFPDYPELKLVSSQMYDVLIACYKNLQEHEMRVLRGLENILCGGNLKSTQDDCSIDAGAPLTHLGILYGVSWSGMTCNNYPTIYAKVGLYTKWIDEMRKQGGIEENQTISTISE